MLFRKPCHMPFRKLIPPFPLTGVNDSPENATNGGYMFGFLLGQIRFRDPDQSCQWNLWKSQV